MAYPNDLVRTKDWVTEVLTDADLEGQLDAIINWIIAAMDVATGHDHAGAANKGKHIKTIVANFQDLDSDVNNQNVKVQCGWSFGTVDGTGYVTKAITFPEAFSAVPYSIQVTVYGHKNGADPTTRTDFEAKSGYGVFDGLTEILGSGMTVSLHGAEGLRYLFYWEVKGAM